MLIRGLWMQTLNVTSGKTENKNNNKTNKKMLPRCCIFQITVANQGLLTVTIVLFLKFRFIFLLTYKHTGNFFLNICKLGFSQLQSQNNAG